MKKIGSLLIICYLHSMAIAQGEACATALSITSGTYNTAKSSRDNGCNNCDEPTSSDWYSFTPTANSFLSLYSYNLGSITAPITRLFIYQGNCGSLTSLCNADDKGIPTNHTVVKPNIEGVKVCAGITYYIEWNNRGGSTPFSFTFNLSTIPYNDLAITAISNEYTMLPKSSGLVKASCLLTNVGVDDINDADVNINIKKNGIDLLPDLIIPSPSALNSTACVNSSDKSSSTSVASNWINISDVGEYVFTYTGRTNGTDLNSSNNTATHRIIVDSVMARDNDIASAGILSDDKKTHIIGHNFRLINADALTSITCKLAGTLNGETIHGVIYSTDVNGKPIEEIGRTTGLIVNPNMLGNYLTMPISGAPVALSAGQTFLVGVLVYNDVTVMASTNTNSRRNTWISNENSWNTLDNSTPIIRANFGLTNPFLSAITGSDFLSDFTISPNPSESNCNVSFELNQDSDVAMRVTDMAGRVFLSTNVAAEAGRYVQTLSFDSFPSGTYNIEVLTKYGYETETIIIP